MKRTGSAIVAAATFGFVLAAGASVIASQRSALAADRRATATARAAATAREMEQHLVLCSAASHVLANHVRSDPTTSLDRLGPELLRAYPGVRTVQLQPGGVVADIYPLAGNEPGLGLDLFADPRRRASAVAARDSRQPTLAGPYPFRQGGVSAVVRTAVYLDSPSGEWFWGFAAATTTFDDLVRAGGLEALAREGYRWTLSGADGPPFGADPATMQDPVQVAVLAPNVRWVLSVVPEAGWTGAVGTLQPKALVTVLATLLAALVYRVLRQREELGLLVRERTRALRDSEARLRQVVENSTSLFWSAARGARSFEYVSPAFARVFGFEPGDAPGRDRLAEAVHPEDRAPFEAATADPLAAADVQYRVVWPDGTTRWIRERTFPVRDAEGRVVRVAGIAEDVSERRELEAAMLQSQKMDAVGRLAGGIAHDFNNLLCVIAANTELLLEGLDPASGPAEDAREVRDAAARATALTRQLLAFSRRQVLQLRVLRPGEVIADLARMLRRVVGEDIAIRVEADDDGLVRADRGQLEQVILNLVVNARDAMPDGGEITISARQEVVSARTAARHEGAAQGPHVVLEVKDTGHGMDAATAARAFEPFFTTKPMAKGTGLGLSTVYGIVRQSGGFVQLVSAPGRGTTVRILVPRCWDRPEDADALGGGALPTGDERVLLVEDEEPVRAVAARVLRRLGYEVLEAADGAAALALVRGGAAVDLLVTDVIMPGLGGRALVETLRAEGFRAPVLFLSGYTADASLLASAGDGSELLEKPFTVETLAAKVRSALPAAGPPR